MKECMRGTGGSSGNFEGKPDDGSGTSGLNIPGRCVGCPYAGDIKRRFDTIVDLEKKRIEAANKHACILLAYAGYTDELQEGVGSIVDEVSADAEAIIEEAAKAAQSEIDQVTANCHGPVTATVESRSSEGTVVEFVGCDSPTLDEGKRTGEYVSFDRHNPGLALEQARQAISALRRSLLPDNDDGSEEGKYVTPPHWIEEIRDADDNKS